MLIAAPTPALLPSLQIALLRVADGGAVLSVADLVATVEAVAGAGDVLFVRLYEGRGAQELGMGGGAATPEARLKTMLPGLVDIPIIMEARRLFDTSPASVPAAAVGHAAAPAGCRCCSPPGVCLVHHSSSIPPVASAAPLLLPPPPAQTMKEAIKRAVLMAR